MTRNETEDMTEIERERERGRRRYIELGPQEYNRRLALRGCVTKLSGFVTRFVFCISARRESRNSCGWQKIGASGAGG